MLAGVIMLTQWFRVGMSSEIVDAVDRADQSWPTVSMWKPHARCRAAFRKGSKPDGGNPLFGVPFTRARPAARPDAADIYIT